MKLQKHPNTPVHTNFAYMFGRDLPKEKYFTVSRYLLWTRSMSLWLWFIVLTLSSL